MAWQETPVRGLLFPDSKQQQFDADQGLMLFAAACSPKKTVYATYAMTFASNQVRVAG